MPPTSDAAWAAYRRLQLLVDVEVARELERDTGLSLPDYDVLTAVADMAATGECVRVRGLAEHMLWPQSRLSRQLGRMERRGLVAREPCELDGRGDDVLLAEPGRAALGTAAPIYRAAVREHFTDLLGPAQLAALIDIGEAVTAHNVPVSEGGRSAKQ